MYIYYSIPDKAFELVLYKLEDTVCDTRRAVMSQSIAELGQQFATWLTEKDKHRAGPSADNDQIMPTAIAPLNTACDAGSDLSVTFLFV
jgi:hypothetical protein